MVFGSRIVSVILAITWQQALASGHRGAGHAGCFVRRGNQMLAVKLTYDGRKYDIPGGQTNWKEPASSTAVRETWEESGYRVNAGRHLRTVRGGFHIYECYLQEGNPGKGPDHEISEVKWMSRGEVSRQLNRGMWRFQRSQAYLYLRWLGNSRSGDNAGANSTKAAAVGNATSIEKTNTTKVLPKTGESEKVSGPRRLFLLV
ncbi:unnamed protein product [Cladocopium goreaui]|uniref:Inositol phosphoceramide mannosyltransferase 3 n=1 Tax=Cladocopium goreaui TaxID=2562237 RepID=A0A9P1BNC1_9DINO|nr:unnamed protein product [Cladocopium goreaui]